MFESTGNEWICSQCRSVQEYEAVTCIYCLSRHDCEFPGIRPDYSAEDMESPLIPLLPLF